MHQQIVMESIVLPQLSREYHAACMGRGRWRESADSAEIAMFRLNNVANLTVTIPALGLVSMRLSIQDMNRAHGDMKASSMSSVPVMVCSSPVPMPSAVWLPGSGLLSLIGIARRTKTA